MENKKFTFSERRINESLLSLPERKLLNFLSAKMPEWITPNLLTIIGLIGSVLIFSGYILSRFEKTFLLLVNVGLIINWFGDSLDGTLARYRKIEKPRFGFFIDHIVDAIAVVLVFQGLGLSSYVDVQLAVWMMSLYLLLLVLAIISAYTQGIFRISDTQIGPTEMRIIAFISNLIMYIFGKPQINTIWGSTTIYSIVMIALIVLLAVIFLKNIFREGKFIYESEMNSLKTPIEKNAQ